MNVSANIFEKVLLINRDLRSFVKACLEPEWAELCSFIQLHLDDPSSLDTLENVFQQKLSRGQLMASLAYLLLIRKPSEARLNACDVALLLWFQYPSRHDDARFREGLVKLCEMGLVSAKFISVEGVAEGFELKRFNKMSDDIKEWMPNFLATSADARRSEKRVKAA